MKICKNIRISIVIPFLEKEKKKKCIQERVGQSYNKKITRFWCLLQTLVTKEKSIYSSGKWGEMDLFMF